MVQVSNFANLAGVFGAAHRQIMAMTGLAGLGRLLGTSGHFIGV